MRPSVGHKIEQLARVLRLDTPPLPVVWYSEQDTARALALLPAGGRAVIALAPTTNWAPKVWPAGNFVELFQRLSQTHLPDALPAILAGPGEVEAAMARPVLQALPNAIDLVGRLSLAEIAAFVARCRLFVGNDSGLMHVAAASGVPTLGLFGPTDAREYAPSGKRAIAVRGTTGAMTSLTVDAVYEAAVRLITT
jgi:heptosyltransferase-3